MVQIGDVDKSVGVPCAAYLEMAKRWRLIDDLRGGTYAMRSAGTTWLPKEEEESDAAWQSRLDRSVLYEGYKDAVRKLIAKPFSRPITLAANERLPEMLQLIEDDADNRRTSITCFGKELFEDGIHRGLTHFVVDYPLRQGPTTEADVLSGDVHPYFVHAPARSVIGWQSMQDDAQGREVLTQVRITEQRTESAGAWDQTTVRYIRVWTNTEWQLWREIKSDEWRCEALGTHDLGVVPLVTVYFNQTGFMTAEPTLEGLAYLNLAHWQSDSDQRNVLHVARVPFLSEVGVPSGKDKEKVVLSAQRVHRTTAVAADYRIGWVEHTGSAIKSGAEDIDRLEARMQKLGMEPMLEPTTPRTATEVSAAQEGNSTSLRDWAGRTNDALYIGYEIAALYGDKATLPDEFSVQIFTDWEVAAGGNAEDLNFLDRLEARGRITPLTLLKEAKRRGKFGEDFDPQAEVDATGDTARIPRPTPEEMAALERLRAARGTAAPAA